ncbi:MAG: hypothetical protein MMC33_003997 [Icmadophila ericetorum]|nr:hypothetical protein [Icmadophila ericetorum]
MFNSQILQLYTYPIKSMRGVPLAFTELTSHGFPYDRRFMIRKILSKEDSSSTPGTPGFRNMTITFFPGMALFTQELVPSPADAESVKVTYMPPASKSAGNKIVDGEGARSSEKRSIEIPLQPDVLKLDKIDAILHSSPTTAYAMPAEINAWFSSCLGYEVQLLYLGPHYRSVLGNLAPSAANSQSRPQPKHSASQSPSWLSSMSDYLPVSLTSIISSTANDENANAMNGQEVEKPELTFADVAPYLVVTEESLASVSDRLPPGEIMDITKFRPNIVVAGAEGAWDEDFWGEVKIKLTEGRASKDETEAERGGRGEGDRETVKMILTANCARCMSLNIDYSTGDYGEGESGKVLKKLMADRRVDPGSKWSPIFGRYGFLEGDGTVGKVGGSNTRSEKDGNVSVRVGDEVVVGKRNSERTVFVWPGLGTVVG